MGRYYFEYQNDYSDAPAFAALSSSAHWLWVCCGNWTARANSPGLVTREGIDEVVVADRDQAERDVDELVSAGIWTVVDGGYRMEFGPGNDWPLPMWRYTNNPPSSDTVIDEVVPEPDA